MTSSLPLNRFYAGSVATRGPKSWKTFETISSARQSPPPALCCTVRRHMPVGRMGPFTFRRYQTLGEAPSAPNKSMYPDRTSLQLSNADVPECHGPVIGLQEQGTAADFGQPPGMAGGCPQLQVFLLTGSQLSTLPRRRLSLHKSAGAAARRPKVAFS